MPTVVKNKAAEGESITFYREIRFHTIQRTALMDAIRFNAKARVLNQGVSKSIHHIFMESCLRISSVLASPDRT